MQLLGELLLDRANVRVMVRFVGDPQHLMQMMMLLKDSSRSIQFEAFHVFKVRTVNFIYGCCTHCTHQTACYVPHRVRT